MLFYLAIGQQFGFGLIVRTARSPKAAMNLHSRNAAGSSSELASFSSKVHQRPVAREVDTTVRRYRTSTFRRSDRMESPKLRL